MNDNIKFLLLFFGGLVLLVGFLVFGTKYYQIGEQGLENSTQQDEQEQAQNRIAKATYEDADQQARELITNHPEYKKMGGKNLIKLSRDSDLGNLRCLDCDGINYQFVDDRERIFKIHLGFTQLEEGEALIESAELTNPRDEDFSRDLLKDGSNSL